VQKKIINRHKISCLSIAFLKLATIVVFLFSLAGCEEHEVGNTVLMNVTNNVGVSGYFGVCARATQQGSRVKCSTPQLITPGQNRIFVPPYETAYPFFVTLDEQVYACSPDVNGQEQQFFPLESIKNYTLMLVSFRVDGSQKKIAVQCGLAQNSI
jgi:hypothetical protein